VYKDELISMKKLWIFPALTGLLFSIMYHNRFHYFASLLFVYWFFRLVFLKNRKVLLISLTVCLILGMKFKADQFYHRSVISPDQDEFIVSVKPTSFKVDGDLIKFEGKIHTSEKLENIVVRYYVENEEAQLKWIEQDVPKNLYIKGELNPPSENSNFHQFNYRKYLSRNNTYYELEASSLVDITQLDLPSKVPLEYKIDYLRVRLFDYIDQHLFGHVAAYSKTTLFAHSDAINPEVMESYRDVGLVHLLSISGLHIQLLISGIYFILLWLGVTRETASKSLLLILPLYGLAAGFGISVFRAVFQSIFKFTFLLLKKPSSSLDNWALTLILTLFLFPFSIFNLGFQLSYLLSGSLILLSNAPNIKKLSEKRSSLILSACINLISVPILSYHFFEFPWISLFINMIFLPVFSWILFPIIIILFLLSGFFSNFMLFNLLVSLVNQGIDLLESFLSALSVVDGTIFITGRLSLIGMIGLILGIICTLFTLEVKNKKVMLLTTGLFLTVFFLFSKQYSPLGMVSMIDVGQGESIVIKPPFSSKAMMIDTGGKLMWQEEEWKKRSNEFEIATDIVIPVLKSEGITSIKELILSHGDADHVGEVGGLIENFSIEKIITTRQTLQTDIIAENKQLYMDENILFQLIEPPEVLLDTLVPLNVISPVNMKDNKNEDSLVLVSDIGEYRWLFTGDIEKMTEEELVRTYNHLQVDILKVAHHGSNTSTTEEFLNLTRPHIAMISAGENNPYNHPHPDVLGRLKENQLTIYRTDVHGGIKYQYSPINFIHENIENFITNQPKRDIIK